MDESDIIVDNEIDPINNFYLYANGIWEKNTIIPNDSTEWGTFHIAQEKTTEKIRKILEKLSNSPTNENYWVGLLYKIILNIPQKNENSLMKRINDYTNIIEKIIFAEGIGSILGYLTKIGIQPFFSIDATEDIKNSKIVRLTLSSPLLSLPEREYYFNETFSRFRDEFINNIKIFLDYCIKKRLLNVNYDNLHNIARDIFDLERKIASMMKSKIERKNFEKLYTKLTKDNFIENVVSNVEPDKKDHSKKMWQNFFKKAHLDIEYIITYDVEFFKRLTHLLVAIPLDKLSIYLRYIFIRKSGIVLVEEIDEIDFTFFGNVMQGQNVIAKRYKRIIELFNSLIGDVIGREYINSYYYDMSSIEHNTINYALSNRSTERTSIRSNSIKSTEVIESMIENIKNEFIKSINSCDWMSEYTRKNALLKLHTLRNKIAYPSKWRDYTEVTKIVEKIIEIYKIDEKFNEIHDLGYIYDILIIMRIFCYENCIIKKIDRYTDDTCWHMNAHEVNAYYNPQKNEIVFPAGIIQPPFFDKNKSIFENYGSIGTIIGHEITHGFDDQGRKYDHNGNYNEWWTISDLQKFNEISRRMIEQYESYTIDGRKVSGELTLGENLADLGGVTLAYRAATNFCNKENIIITNDMKKNFFINFANLWKKKIKPERSLMKLITDFHSPGMFRVFILRNINEFYQVFDKMSESERELYEKINNNNDNDNMFLKKIDRIKYL